MGLTQKLQPVGPIRKDYPRMAACELPLHPRWLSRAGRKHSPCLWH